MDGFPLCRNDPHDEGLRGLDVSLEAAVIKKTTTAMSSLTGSCLP